jgi:hypothetical protein
MNLSLPVKTRTAGKVALDAAREARENFRAVKFDLQRRLLDAYLDLAVVGATQDLLALKVDLASVMQAGRWKSNRMPMRYGEEVLAARGGMARAAAAQGRDSDALDG